MKHLTSFVFTGILVAAVSQMASAEQLTGNIDFTGEIFANSSEASGTTMAINWDGMQVSGTPGADFTSHGVPTGEAAAFTGSWNFNDPTTQIYGFWTANAFAFILTDSFIDPSVTSASYPLGSMKVDVNGTVIGNGYASTPFTGTLTFSDPNDGNGPDAYTALWSFTAVPVPEPGSMVLLGTVLPVLAFLSRKFRA